MSLFSSIRFPGQLAVVLLASALSQAAVAQQPSATPDPSSAAQPSPTAQATANQAHEGFWGRVNPFARKKWVNRQLDPINGQISELNEVNAKNARDIKDVDARAQAGIGRAQSTADQAAAAANAAGQQAAQAGTVAGQATGKVNNLTQTVNGLDQYSERKSLTITFRGGQPVLSAESRQQLDDLATAINGHQGYLLELSAYAPAAGSVGIQNSQKLAETVKRYLVTQHNIPVYRMHAVALGNAQPTDAERVRTSKVEVRLMENTLAASGESTPRSDSLRNGSERP